jgi:hypothetical protein
MQLYSGEPRQRCRRRSGQARGNRNGQRAGDHGAGAGAPVTYTKDSLKKTGGTPPAITFVTNGDKVIRSDAYAGPGSRWRPARGPLGQAKCGRPVGYCLWRWPMQAGRPKTAVRRRLKPSQIVCGAQHAREGAGVLWGGECEGFGYSAETSNGLRSRVAPIEPAD